MPDCLFCKIASGTIPAKLLHQDGRAVAFADLHPQAPTHLLVIPKDHFADATEVPADLLGHLLHVAAGLGRSLLPGGHRIVVNTGPSAGQTVQHVHLHLLGGRPLSWPPG